MANYRNNFHLCFFVWKQCLIFAAMKDGVLRITVLEEAEKFLDGLPYKAKRKVLYNVSRILKGERDKELFKKLENTEIWEFRTLYDKTAYRLFAFWDAEEETLIVATHGIIKKSQKTPQKEIARAEAIRKEYFYDKNK